MEAEILVLFLRIIIPILIFKWNFFGMLLSIILDANDVKLIKILDGTLWNNYHAIDKVLDMEFLLIAFICSLNWKGIIKNFSIALFTIRSLGFLLFEITGTRYFLFLFPNVFEFWFVFWAYIKDFGIKIKITNSRLYLLSAIMTIIKIGQEILLHVINNCDKYIYCGLELLI